MTSIATPGLWLTFGSTVVGLLVLDLFAFHRKAHVVRTPKVLP